MEPTELAEKTRQRIVGTRWQLQWVASTGSTNADLMAAAADGEPAGRVLAAEFQGAGRGRLDRRWVAPPGSSLLVSVLMRPTVAVSAGYLSAVAVAVAAAEAIDEVTGVAVGLKWPNDLVIDVDGQVRKLGGVLSESLVSDGVLAAVVVGIGINVLVPDEVPDELAAIATWLDQHTGPPPGRNDDHAIDRSELLAALLRRLDELADQLNDDDGRSALLATYRSRCVTLGENVRVERAGDVITGMAAAIDDDGQLVVVDDTGHSHTVAVGDVVHVRATA